MALNPCKIKMKRGWYCIRRHHGYGPCALAPYWWNLSRSARAYRKRRHL